MKFKSILANSHPTVTAVFLKEAILSNISSDGGLFMPEFIPTLNIGRLKKSFEHSFQHTAFSVLEPFCIEDISSDQLADIIKHAFTFDAPLRHLSERIYTLELFHGPSFAFKDFGVRLMAELLCHFRNSSDKKLTVLTATSGDTGGAVTAAFNNRPDIDVFVLYPKNKVSDVQEKQIAMFGGNITAICMEGNFDDCQRIVKKAFGDPEIAAKRDLCSANSINISRLLAQVCYYVHAYLQLPHDSKDVTVSVPSGNFGNLTAGLIAKRMGVPFGKFIAATNKNDIVPRYLASGEYKVQAFQETLANAMDIAEPGNFSRIQHLHSGSLSSLQEELYGFSASDPETEAGIRELDQEYSYLSEPHGAIGYLGLKKFLSEVPPAGPALFLGTAHPSKFQKTVEHALGHEISLPGEIKKLLDYPLRKIELPCSYESLKDLLV